eukprot:TRINITY_DN118047_c0_g1_i1.p1 TRINITY_DN118047_c0_g1~~TRINITY_DN118047_c0_g1_i1.p1  ORF type:complete len:162 (-),score=23.12 TRINITY_DN118047_c0_g1_i1:164-649(-)
MVIRRIFGRVAAVREWYEELDIAEKLLLYTSAGMYWGTWYGTRCRRGKIEAPESDYLLATQYDVPASKKKSFEASWSDMARLAQRQPGYEWTKTFKALDWEDSPFHYVSFRMWTSSGDYRRFTNMDRTWKELSKRLTENCDKQQDTVYRIIVDDSVKRIID